MKYYSTNHPQDIVSMQDAIIGSIPADGGLYMPLSLPKIPAAFVQNMSDMSLREIAYVTSNVFLGDDFASSEIKKIVDSTLAFDIPLVAITDNVFVLELFHGPTGVFKDIGIRFLAGLLTSIKGNNPRPLNVLVSTTGITGDAVASAFGSIEGINVFILCPHGTVSKEMTLRMLSAGNNIHVVEVSGTIDDCKAMIASAFNDVVLREDVILCSANSTNFARLIPQVALFFYAAARLAKHGNSADAFDISLPSGNLGMLTAGVMAKHIGLQCGRLIGACNSNNAFDRFMKSGVLTPAPTIRTLAPIMDMATPANLPRLMALCDGDMDRLRREVDSATVSDEQIISVIRQMALNFGYIADPHAAVALKALEKCDDNNRSGLIFATADPAKSSEIINKAVGGDLLAEGVSPIHCASGQRKPERLAPTYPAFKKYLLSHQ